MSSSTPPIPNSILIIGAGVFGLSAAHELATHAEYQDTKITLVDRHLFPAPDGASIDTSRIIRADYSDPSYASLAAEAQDHWRSEWGADGRYTETGLVLTSDADQPDYVAHSLENVLDLEKECLSERKPWKKIQRLNCNADIERVTKTGGASGSTGYVNWNSGWADAEASMRWLYYRTKALNRVEFIESTVQRLLINHTHSIVEGAMLSNGQTLRAEQTILAAGAWTPSLIDVRGIVRATGQVLTYISLEPAEQEHLAKTPVQLNMSTGMFVIPPPLPPPSSSSAILSPEEEQNGIPKPHRFLKVARHGHGYLNPISIPHPESANNVGKITVSLPHTNPSSPWAHQPIPTEAMQACRNALRSFIPSTSSNSRPHANANTVNIPIADRPWSVTRICHYADTRSGSFILAFHPAYSSTATTSTNHPTKSLFVATGDSGHAFKFLPVIGRKIVECLLGRTDDRFVDKWSWPDRIDREEEEAMWEGDGSRGGKRGMVLEQEMGAGGASL